MNDLAGTWELVRFNLRRDRLVMPLWVLVLAASPALVAYSFGNLLPSALDRERFFATTASQPAYQSLLGPGFGSSIGALSAQRSGIVFLLVGIASVLTVIRHTRSEEEAGRRELLGSAALGRQAYLASALIVAVVANVALALLTTLGMMSQGLSAEGSVAFGCAVGATGLIFASFAALAAQLTQGAGDARGLCFIAIGLAFMVRLIGDAAGAEPSLRWISWLSPIGWMQRTRAFEEERWWVFAVALASIVIATLLAWILSARRDLGAGILAPRLGPPAASPILRSPLALAWALQRRALFAWLAGLVLFGCFVGAITETGAEAIRDNPRFADIIKQLSDAVSFSDIYLTAIMGFAAFVAAGCAIQAAMRLRTEEEEQRAELVLAAAVGRVSWLASHLIFAVLAPVVVLAAFGLTAGVGHGIDIGDIGDETARVLAAALAQLPVVWLMAALAVALFGLWPKLTGLTWAALVVFLLISQFGAILDLHPWVLAISPFSHSPRLPGGDALWMRQAILCAAALALFATGIAAFRRRDLTS